MFNLIATIYLFVMIVLPFFACSVYATEMSSKRDCAICHIMWLNDFRTDKETLIEWQPGNVLMKDTQGVVSSEEICYSCHDGYVSDSRSIVWKHNNHHTFVKPSSQVNIPATLPLSNKDEIYCGTCHSAHGAGAAPESGSGMTSFFREKNIGSSLCESCHRNPADFRRTNSHPLKTTDFKIPAAVFELGSKHVKQKNKVICETCHQAHGAKGDKILIVDNRNSALCLMCHVRQESLVGSVHDLRISWPDEKNSKQQQVSESGPCGACHVPHNGANKKLWARQLGIGNPASEMCLSCHGKTSVRPIKQIGDASHPVDIEPAPKTMATGRLPLYSTALVQSGDGRIQCFTCHEVHQWDPDSAENRRGRDVEGDASNSFLRIANRPASGLCIECHSNRQQLITSDHNLVVTAPEEKNLQKMTVKDSGPCSACHIPHNASGRRLWSKGLPPGRDFVSQLCTGCHSKEGCAKTKPVGDNDHPVNIVFQRIDIEAAAQKELFPLPLYDDAGDHTAGTKIVCLTCHEPHNWDPKSTAPLSNYAFKNMEGDPSNSFLRKANAPLSSLCEICHTDKSFVEGTDHDLNVTAPDSVNLLSQTVKISGPCGACHMVHNSPNKIKLWARPYGPYLAYESLINSLCRSCHSKGNNAANKVPPVAFHPEGRLTTNLDQLAMLAKAPMPIFSKDGREVNVGYISCPSCHNAHLWSSFTQEKGPNKNMEGDTKNSFLRNVSYETICKDCHGPGAIIRYKYFHNPVLRSSFKNP